MSKAISAAKLERKREALMRRLVFAARQRCTCGAGLAYDRRAGQPVWDCSAILLGDAMFVSGERGACEHSAPQGYYDVLSERQAAAEGATTRPA